MPTAIQRAPRPLAAAVCSALLAGCSAAPPGADSRPASAVPRPASGAAVGGSADPVPQVDVSMEALRGHVAPAIVETRNPFRFGAAAGAGRASAAGGGATDSPGRGPGPGAGPAGGAPGDTAARETLDPPGPLAGLRLIGFVETRGDLERVAVLADGDGVFYGVANDVVNGRYRVLAVRGASVEVEDVAGGTRRTLRLPES